MSTDSSSPASIIGGTWSQIPNRAMLRSYKDGDAVEGQAAPGSTDGDNFISIKNMPAHNHTIQGYIQKYDSSSDYLYGGSSGHFRYSGVQNAPTNNAGSGKRFLGYHYSCYMWRRTA